MTGMICPTCGTKGRRVKPITVESLAHDAVRERLQTREGFGFCPALECTVAWFRPESGEVVDKTELKVRIGMKETTDPRPICYCFGHDAADLEVDIRRNGRSDIPAGIAAKCKQGLDRCEETNPQGSCCLGNVNRVVKEAGRQAEVVPPLAQPFATAADPGCCSIDEKENAHE